MSAAMIRARPLRDFYAQAEAINDSAPLMAIYAAPEWDELSSDGRAWVAALVRETIAQTVAARIDLVGLHHILPKPEVQPKDYAGFGMDEPGEVKP